MYIEFGVIINPRRFLSLFSKVAFNKRGRHICNDSLNFYHKYKYIHFACRNCKGSNGDHTIFPNGKDSMGYWNMYQDDLSLCYKVVQDSHVSNVTVGNIDMCMVV